MHLLKNLSVAFGQLNACFAIPLFQSSEPSLQGTSLDGIFGSGLFHAFADFADDQNAQEKFIIIH